MLNNMIVGYRLAESAQAAPRIKKDTPTLANFFTIFRSLRYFVNHFIYWIACRYYMAFHALNLLAICQYIYNLWLSHCFKSPPSTSILVKVVCRYFKKCSQFINSVSRRISVAIFPLAKSSCAYFCF